MSDEFALLQPGDLADDSPRALANLQRATLRTLEELIGELRDTRKELAATRTALAEVRAENGRLFADHNKLADRVDAHEKRISDIEAVLVQPAPRRKR